MKKGNSKRKGSQYERHICKQLSLWWTQDFDKPRDDVFWLCSQSGGRATTRAKQNITTAYSQGDVTFIDPIGEPFIDSCLLELKRGYSKDISLLDFIDRKKGTPILVKWWEKAIGEQKLAGREYTILIFRRDRHKSCIMMDSVMFADIEEWYNYYVDENIHIHNWLRSLIVIDFNGFLDWCHPDFFRKG